MKLGVIAFCLSVSLSAMAVADEEVVRRLSGYHFEDEVWNYIPVHDPETGLVDAIVAIAKLDATIGDNLNTVLFIREGNEFEAWSWRNATRARAVYSAKMILNVSDEDDANWLLEEGELPWLDDNQMRPPVPYMAGMLTDDPLFEPVMESENPAALVVMLQEMGYPVALLRPSEGGGETGLPCPETAELRPMLETIEWALNIPINSEAESILTTSAMAAMLRNCSGNCTPSQTPWVVAPEVPGACEFLFAGGPDNCIPIAPGTDRCLCHYQARRTFTQSRSCVRTKANCSRVPCSQTRTGFRWGAVQSCQAEYAKVNAGDPPRTCPQSPSCSLTDPVCSATTASSWTQYQPDCP